MLRIFRTGNDQASMLLPEHQDARHFLNQKAGGSKLAPRSTLFLEPPAGIEPAHSALQGRRTTTGASAAWSAHGESNSVLQPGKLACYRNTSGALVWTAGFEPA